MAKKIILWVLTLFCAAAIFGFSSQNGAASSQVSAGVSQQILETFTDYPQLVPERQHQVLEITNRSIRALAHFSLFLLLGLFSSLLAMEYNILHPVLSALGICILYALLDELHQGLFVFGRAFEFVDLLKDWGGSLLGALFASVANRIWADKISRR